MDIGTLTGHIMIEDQLTGKLSTMIVKVQQFAEEFDGAFGAIAIGAGAAVAALASVTAGIVALGSKGSTILGVEDAFNRLAEAAGTTGEALIGGLDKGLRSTVDSMEEMQAVSQAMQAGVKLTAADMELMGAAARAMGKATGTDATQGLHTLSSALTTGRTRALAMQGIIVEMEGAEAKYAEALGLTASQLTETQKLEAKRQAILEATQEYVERLGESEISLKERVQQSAVAIGNWFDDLAKGVASSDHVTEAFDRVRSAIEETFGASSQTLLENILSGIDKFADGVSRYGPPIVKAFGWIYDTIVNIFTAVRDAYNAIPDWLKEVAKDAAIAGAAMLIVGKSIGTVTTITEQLTGETMSGGLRSFFGDWATGATAVSGTLSTFKDLSGRFDDLGDKMRNMRTGLNTFADSMSTAAGSSATFFKQLGTGAIVAASATAVITAGYQAWKLWGESADRAASAAKQAELDQTNLARINESLGTSFTTLDAAVKAARENIEKSRVPVVELTEAEKLLLEQQEKHAKAVDKVYQSYAEAAAQIDYTAEVFDKLTGAQKINADVQKMLIAQFDKRIEQGGKLREIESDYYQMVVSSRLNFDNQSAAILAANKVSLERIEIMRKMGMTEAEIAQALGTTVNGLKKYSAELTTLKNVTMQYQQFQEKMTMTSSQAAIAGYQREYEAAVASLDKTSQYYAATEQKIRQLRDARIEAEGSSWATISEQSREASQARADAALADYNRMLYSGQHFNHEVLEKQLEYYRKLKDEAMGLGTTTVTETKKMTNEVIILNQAWAAYGTGLDSATVKVRTLHGELLTLAEAERRRTSGGSYTYDLSTEEGINEYFTKNTAARTNLSNEQIMSRAKKGATLEDLVKSGAINPYGGFGSGLNIPGFAKGGIVTGPTLAMVGEAGPEMITPLSAGGAGAVINNVFNLSGSTPQAVRQIANELMRQLKQVRQFGSA